MRNYLLIILALLLMAGCQSNDGSDGNRPAKRSKNAKRDWSEIRKSGVLKVITVYSETSYFLYRGRPMGFEYQLLERLADHLGVELEIIPANDLTDLIGMLNRGEGDLLAHGLTVTSDRRNRVNFTDYLYLTKQVLVQRKPDNWRQMKLHEIQRDLISDPIELIGDTVSVRAASSYVKRIRNLSNEIGGVIHVDTVDGRYSTGRIIEMVQAGDIKYTIADENIASINASYYPDLDIGTQVSFSQRAAWALRKSSPELRDTINDWIKAMRKEAEYYVIYNKYFKNTRSFRTREASNFYSSNDESEGQLSPYDELIKEYAENLGWDWRFLSAQVYQESQFDPGASSWANAEGLMQLMPATARSYGITDRSDPEQSLRGGTEFLADLWEEWSGIPDSLQRLKFTLASFNCGLYHVKDAVALAEAEGDDPTQWDNSVEDWVLNLTYPEHHNRPEVKYGYVRGQEPVQYVRQIFDRYQRYQTLLPNQEVRM